MVESENIPYAVAKPLPECQGFPFPSPGAAFVSGSSILFQGFGFSPGLLQKQLDTLAQAVPDHLGTERFSAPLCDQLTEDSSTLLNHG
jgi:hypothetical protein